MSAASSPASAAAGNAGTDCGDWHVAISPGARGMHAWPAGHVRLQSNPPHTLAPAGIGPQAPSCSQTTPQLAHIAGGLPGVDWAGLQKLPAGQVPHWIVSPHDSGSLGPPIVPHCAPSSAHE
jgi:hypothetical protein